MPTKSLIILPSSVHLCESLCAYICVVAWLQSQTTDMRSHRPTTHRASTYCILIYYQKDIIHTHTHIRIDLIRELVKRVCDIFASEATSNRSLAESLGRRHCLYTHLVCGLASQSMSAYRIIYDTCGLSVLMIIIWHNPLCLFFIEVTHRI